MADNLKTVELYRKFLLAQYAAESYLTAADEDYHLVGTVIDVKNGEVERNYDKSSTLVGRLALGPNDATKYAIDKDGNQITGERWSATLSTKEMLRQFGTTWIIVDQIANTNSGFSATLLYNKDSNEYTLSFRSTESKSEVDGGDVLRDSSNGANGEIAMTGFAWAQIMDMERYFSGLLEGKLASNNNQVDPVFLSAFAEKAFKVTVTGYSLGSHLAQVFTRMHDINVTHTYIFNGAGMGQFKDIESQNLSVDYKRDAYGNHLRSATGDLIQQYETIKKDPAAFFSEFYAEAYSTALMNSILSKHAAAEAEKNIYNDPYYQAARQLIYDKYEPTCGIKIGVKELLPWVKQQIVEDPDITNLFGLGDTNDSEFTAGSGSIFGSWDSIFIEDQPLYSTFDDSPNMSWSDRLFRSIGETHSISLVIDSLMLTESLMTFSPTTLTTRQEVEHLLYSASSNERATGRYAEGHSLENILDAVGTLLFGVEGDDKWVKSAVDDTNDSKSGGFSNLYNRNRFQENIARINTWKEKNPNPERLIVPLWESASGQEVCGDNANPFNPDEHLYHTVSGLAAKIAGFAKDSNNPDNLAYRYALKNLTPFAITGEPSLYDKFDKDGELSEEDWTKDAVYLQDRADFLVQLLHLNMNNTGDIRITSSTNVEYTNLPAYYFHDFTTGIQALNASYSNQAVYYIPYSGLDSKKKDYEQRLFGSDSTEKTDILQGGDKADHLYGMDGNDILIGGKGDDYMEGGKGLDTYFWTAGDGNDTIIEKREEDGKILGVIDIVNSSGAVSTAAGAFMQQETDDIWNKTMSDGQVVTLSHGSTWQLKMTDGSILDLGKDFQDGDFGIRLVTQLSDPDAAIFDGIDNHDGLLYGSAGNDHMFVHGNYVGFHGMAGDDIMEGGSDKDYLLGNDGQDELIGGADNDGLYGGEGDDVLYGVEKQDLQVLFQQGETGTGTSIKGDLLNGDGGDDQIYGNTECDLLMGGAGADMILGGAGDDIIEGDMVITDYSSFWSMARFVDTQGSIMPFGYYAINVDFVFPDPAEHDDDVIFGQVGDDTLFVYQFHYANIGGRPAFFTLR